MILRLFSSIALCLSLLLLSGCDDPKDKAEKYFQSGLTLLEEGDVDRALIEFRNVFKYDPLHKEARKLYADTVLTRGDTGEAYGQYLRLIEQYPDTPDVRQSLAELALRQNNWEEVKRHGEAAIDLMPDAPRSRAISAALAYRDAKIAEDPEAEAAAVKNARAVLEDAPNNAVARRILIAALAEGRTPSLALAEIDKALALDPENLEYQTLKLRILLTEGNEDSAGAQLEEMFKRFPDNPEIRQSLISWYINQQDYDATEALLRKLADSEEGAGGALTVVQFLNQTKGVDAALAELESLISANGISDTDKAIYRASKASLIFEQGDQSSAIAQMQEIVAEMPESDESRRIKILLAQMLLATGDEVGARAKVEEVLENDASNVEALKMRAVWLISEDNPDGAINDLRNALDQSPRDPSIFTMMAQAYERAGSPELAGERLALAVEVSNAAPEESMRYASYMLRNGRTQAAESVLLDARRTSPGNLAVLSQLADLWLSQQNWDGLRQILDQLERANTVQTQPLATRLRAAMLLGQNRVDDGLALLEQQIKETESDNASAQMVVLQLRANKLETARKTLDEALLAEPENFDLRLLDGTLSVLSGDSKKAESIFRKLTAQNPAAELPVLRLFGLLKTQGRLEEAEVVLDAALAAQPDAGRLQWLKAEVRERAGDINGAIAIYEDLYARDSNNMAIANNLASLLVTRDENPETIERAFVIGRRLSGQEVPPFQDTYGWLLTLRGNPTEALEPLQAAVEGLPEDPLVRYHLGMTYAALEQREKAIEVLTKALSLAGTSSLPQFDKARATIAELEAALAANQ